MKRFSALMVLASLLLYVTTLALAQTKPTTAPYPIVGTGQTKCYDARTEIPAPQPAAPFFGQDAQHPGPAPAYQDNADGTISDTVTGLMWVKARGSKVTWNQASADAPNCRVAGHTDWRMPTIKELYSLINFTGAFRLNAQQSTPYLNTRIFDFKYGDLSLGEREIDCQDWSATTYVGTTMNGNPTAFGVNFADGRIKGYPKSTPRGDNKRYVRYVRGNPSYGRNDFHDNKDGTITDRATTLTWSKDDSAKGMDWPTALAWVQAKNREAYLGHSDWRLPNAKELQSLVDYTHAPAATDPAARGPAIDPLFTISRLPDGDYPFFWTSTTHLDGPPDRAGTAAVYVSFGRATGWMSFPPGRGELQLLDVHGAGAQRSDPKTGDPADYPHGRGPQSDVIRITNYVRLVRSSAP